MAIVHFFGRLRELAGKDKISIELPSDVTTPEEARSWLDDHFQFEGALKDKNIRIIINHQLNGNIDSITDADEISFLPPVSGG